jgi:hypothetical protein
MIPAKLPLNYQQICQLALGVALLSPTSATALEPSRNTLPENLGLGIEKNIPFEIAQNFSLCEDPGGDFYPRVWAETRDFLVNICYYAEGGLATYYGRAKRGGASISVPVESERGGRYVAANGDTRYILTRNELIVTQRGRTILRQRVLRFRTQ